MGRAQGFLEESAGWAAGFKLEDAPPSVVEAGKILVADTIAAMLSSLNTRPGREACRELEGVLGRAEKMASLSVLLDHDSTLLYYGHVGHGAVPAPLLVSGETMDGAGLLEAVIASAEVGARLAASLSFSRARGQMLTVVHSLTAATALGKAAGLGPEQLGRAMALSLAYTVKPTRAGFTTTAKALAAANGVSLGLRSHRLARLGGIIEPSTVLENLLKEWGGVVLHSPLGGYGERWHLETLSVKPWPACSYAQTAVEAALRIAAEVDAGEVEEILVEGSALTYYMDKMHEPAVRGVETPFTTLQFYTPYIVAYTLARKRFGREAYEPGSTRDSKVWRLAAKTRSIHNTGFTAQLLAEPLPFGVAVGELGPARSLAMMARLLGSQALRIAIARPGILRGYRLDEVDLAEAEKHVPVRVAVRARSGKVESEAWTVEGFHGTGRGAKSRVAMGKLLGAAERLLGEEAASSLASIVSRLEKAGEDEVGLISSLVIEALRC